jgi:hypothetical protein
MVELLYLGHLVRRPSPTQQFHGDLELDLGRVSLYYLQGERHTTEKAAGVISHVLKSPSAILSVCLSAVSCIDLPRLLYPICVRSVRGCLRAR